MENHEQGAQNDNMRADILTGNIPTVSSANQFHYFGYIFKKLSSYVHYPWLLLLHKDETSL